MALSVTSDAAWRALARAVGEETLSLPTEATAEERRARHTEVDDALEAWTSARTLPDVAATLDACGVAYGVVRTSFDLHEDPHLIARGALSKVAELQIAETLYPRFAWLIDGVEDPASAPAHLYGQHSVAVFKDMVGLTDDEVQSSLRQRGVQGGAHVVLART